MDFIENPPGPVVRAWVTASVGSNPGCYRIIWLKMLVKCDINVAFFNILQHRLPNISPTFVLAKTQKRCHKPFLLRALNTQPKGRWFNARPCTNTTRASGPGRQPPSVSVVELMSH